MQIHELTRPRAQIDEGFMDTVNNLKKALKTPGAMTSTAKFNQIKQQGQSQQQTSDYVKKLAAEWLQVAKTMPPTEPTPAPTTQSTPAKKTAPGQMPAGVAASKTGQNMQKMLGQPKGGIQGMQSDLEEAASGNNAFQKWVDGKMSSTIPGTRQQLTMDMVRKEFPEINGQLTSALARVEQAPTDSVAIEAYIAIAVQGIQRLSQQLKQQDPSLAKKANFYQTGPAQRTNNYVKTTNNPEADAVLKAQGFIVQ
jgi:hypothetical protein